MKSSESRTKVFVSYSRADGSFAESLRDRLIDVGFEAYLDKHDIAPGEDWRGRLGALIESADTILFVISPDSVQSKICDWEVNHAELLGKRIIPIVCRETKSDAVPERLKRLNYVFMRSDSEKNTGIPELAKALEVNIAWIRQHTSYGEHAGEWERAGRPNALLLRGGSIDAAERWRDQRPPTAPELSDKQRAYIATSRLAATRRQRWWIAGASFTAIVTTILSAYAFNQKQAAVQRLQSLQSNAISARVPSLLDSDLDLALLLGVEAINLDANAQARGALLTALTHRKSLVSFVHVRRNLDSMAISPRGDTVAFGDDSGVLFLWSADTGQQIGAPLLVRGGRVRALSFSSDGAILATLSDDGAHTYVTLWDVESRERLGEPLSLGPGVRTLCFGPDSGHLAAASSERVYLLERREGRLVPSLLGSSDSAVDAVAFTPDGQSIAVGSRDGNIRMWDLSERRSTAWPIKAHNGWISSLAFSRDGEILATGDIRGVIRLWNAVEPTLLAEASQKRPDKRQTDEVRHLAFSSDQNRLISVGHHVVRQWDTSPSMLELSEVFDDLVLGETAPPIIITDPFSAASALSSDGSLIASGGHDGRVALWSPTKTQPLATSLPEFISDTRDIAFSPDGEVLAVASLEGIVRLWDMRTRELIEGSLVTTGKQRILSVTFSPNGRKLVAGGSGGILHMWSIQSGSAAIVLPIDPDTTKWVRSIAFHPHKNLIAIGGDDGSVRAMELAEGTTGVETIGTHEFPVQLVSFSENGRTLMSVGRGDSTIRFWDVRKRRLIGRPLRLETYFDRVAISPDHELLALATGNVDVAAQFWDVKGNRPVGTKMPTGDETLWSLAFSPDGAILATAGDDRSIGIWEVPTGRAIGRPLTAFNKVRALAFSPDGKMLASADIEGVQLWNLNVESWRDLACTLANRNLSKPEWMKYFADEPYHKTCPEFPIPEWREGEVISVDLSQ